MSSSLLAPGQQKHAQLPAPKSLNQQIITLTLQMFNFLLRLHRVCSRRGRRGNNLNPEQLQERRPPHGLLPRSPTWGLDAARGAPRLPTSWASSAVTLHPAAKMKSPFVRRLQRSPQHCGNIYRDARKTRQLVFAEQNSTRLQRGAWGGHGEENGERGDGVGGG